ncbi:hypothetical protein ABW19_dt0206304 [Dactylella cylindrospora]|nr:hypothetical protein ABW19_dt0206304 [Dactylella cylindrospora]
MIDPRSSTGSLGSPYGPATPILHQGGGGRYLRDPYDSQSSGGAIVHTGGNSRPVYANHGYSYYPPEEFEERRQRHRSKSRPRAKTPGPGDKASSDGTPMYRVSVRPSSTSPSPPRRAKSRRRRESQSPPPPQADYRSKSRARSRPRPEVIQTRLPRGDTPPPRATTPGVSRPKTPMPEPGAAPWSPIQAPEDILRAREIERERDRERAEQERIDQEKAEMIEWEKGERERVERERIERERIEREMYEKSNNDWGYDHHGREKDRDHEKRRRHKSRRREGDSESAGSNPSERERDREKDRTREKDKDRERKKDREKDRDRSRDREVRKEKSKEKHREESSSSGAKEEPSKPYDPVIGNPRIEYLGLGRERAGVQPGQVFIRPDLLCAMRSLGLCIAEEDPSDDHAHNQLLRLDCGHGFHEDCLRSVISSKERVSMGSVDLEADKLWCERCRGYFGKKAGR